MARSCNWFFIRCGCGVGNSLHEIHQIKEKMEQKHQILPVIFQRSNRNRKKKIYKNLFFQHDLTSDIELPKNMDSIFDDFYIICYRFYIPS